MILRRIQVLGTAALLALIGWVAEPAAARADEAQLELLRKALEKYKDPYVAIKDLYLSTVGYVYYDGMSAPGHMQYPKGAMGIHFVNLTIQGPPDPLRPNVLLYEPRDGKLHLVGAEMLSDPIALRHCRVTRAAL